MAGRFVGHIGGWVVHQVKAHAAVVAMSYSLNLEEFVHGIRSTVICPGEVATAILDQRPVPVPAADRARMLQPEDLARTIAHVATTAPHVCLNEIVVSPAWNRHLARGLGAATAPSGLGARD
ncbi:MAG: hypothetical protein R3E83_01760 [Burkholderiaceae bacterium]